MHARRQHHFEPAYMKARSFKCELDVIPGRPTAQLIIITPRAITSTFQCGQVR